YSFTYLSEFFSTLKAKGNGRQFLQPFNGILKKFLICPAEIIFSLWGIISPASASAQRIPVTGRTGSAPLFSLCKKSYSGKILPEKAKIFIPDISRPVLVQDIKIAGKHISVCLYDILHRTASHLSTGLRRISSQHSQPVIKLPHRNPLSFHHIPVPQIEQLLQGVSIIFRCKRPGSSASFLSQWIQAGNILLVIKPLFFQKIVYRTDLSCALFCKDTENIHIPSGILKEPGIFQYLFKSLFTSGVLSVPVMDLLDAVHGDTCKEMMLF